MNKLQEKLIAKVEWLYIVISLVMLISIFFFPDTIKAIVVVSGFIATAIVVIYSRKKFKKFKDNK